jgi:hypothetical protein
MESGLLKEICKKYKAKRFFSINSQWHIIRAYHKEWRSNQLDRESRYEVALVNLETYYSFPNVDASNNLLKYSNNDGR